MSPCSIRALARLGAVGCGALLAACAASTDLVKPCCYVGPTTLARIDQLTLAMENGDRARFAEIFRGFRPATGAFSRVFPFSKVDIRSVTYGHLSEILPGYDANANTVLEEPELATLYVREAARGLGHPVDHLGGKAPIGALVLSAADIGRLVNYVEDVKPHMNPAARAIFDELDLLGRDIRTRGSEGGDHDGSINWND